MKAIRVHAYGPPDRLIYEDAPDPEPGPGEVVISVEASGVNPADYKFRNGLLASVNPKSLPFTPGVDVAGTVSALGEGVTGVAIGDPVLAMLFLMGNGGYAERVSAPAEWCALMPAGLDMVTAAALPTPATTAVEWIEDDLQVGPGQRVLITGATGAVGTVACYVAKGRGAKVTGAVRRAQAAQARYVDDILILDEKNGVPSGWYDCIADTIGGATAMALLPTLKVGAPLSTVATDPVQNPDTLNVAIRFFGNHPDAARLAAIAADVTSGRLSIAAPRVLKMSEAWKAHELAERGGAGKIVLVPDSLA